MTIELVVEDGTGENATANSWGSVAEADAYFAARGNTTWAAYTTEQKKANLINATDYICNRFKSRFYGVKTDLFQPLEYPRDDLPEGIVPDLDEDDPDYTTQIPVNLKKAQFEYAVRAGAAALAPDPVVDSAGVTVITTKIKAGPVEKESETLFGSRVTLLRPYPAADMYLNGLVAPASMTVIR